MRKRITSRQEILENCQDLVSEKGLNALDIRTVAAACHVSVGSIYNHFESKDDLVYGVLNHAWGKIFDLADSSQDKPTSFLDYLEWLFSSLAQKKAEGAEFFNLYSLGLAYKNPQLGRDLFARHTGPLKEELKKAWEEDGKFGKFYEKKESDKKIDFLFTSLIGALLTESISKEDFMALAAKYIEIIQ